MDKVFYAFSLAFALSPDGVEISNDDDVAWYFTDSSCPTKYFELGMSLDYKYRKGNNGVEGNS